MRRKFGFDPLPHTRLVVQDILTLHGSQFKDAALIVASPPCQEYSYMAMPWGRAKAKAAAIRADMTGNERERLNALFNACFRIQREANQAAGRPIPMVVENVRGAQSWVPQGRARWAFGSFYLWGDVPALMPTTLGRNVMKAGVTHRSGGSTNFHGSKVPGFRFDGSGKSFQSASVEQTGQKGRGIPHIRDGAPHTKHLINPAENVPKSAGFNVTAAQRYRGGLSDGVKARDADGYDRNYPAAFGWKAPRTSPKSDSRKAASALIAKIPLTLSRHIAAVYRP
jgi:hypothetical protein